MKFLKFLYYLLFFLGFFPDTVQANSLYLHHNKHFEIHQDKFASGSKEKDWLALLWLKENLSLEFHSEWAGLSQENQAFDKHHDLVDAWSVIKNSGDDDLTKLATNLDEIEAVGGYKLWKNAIKKFDDYVQGL